MDQDLDEVLESQSAMLERQDREKADRSHEKLRQVFFQATRTDKPHAEQPPNSYAPRRSPTNGRAAGRDRKASPQFLDADLDEAAMAAVVDPKLYRQRK